MGAKILSYKMQFLKLKFVLCIKKKLWYMYFHADQQIIQLIKCIALIGKNGGAKCNVNIVFLIGLFLSQDSTALVLDRNALREKSHTSLKPLLSLAQTIHSDKRLEKAGFTQKKEDLKVCMNRNSYL